MAWTIEGSGGSRWTGAAWVARNAFAYLFPALRRGNAGAIAAILDEAYESGSCRASLREILDDERRSGGFRLAVEAAVAEIERDGPEGWHDPSAFTPFVAAVRSLQALCRADGNELVIELASNPLNFRTDHVIGRAEAFTHTK